MTAEWMEAMKAKGAWESEVRHIWPDGREHWARIGVSVWRRDKAGKPVGALAVLQDVTENRRNREQLRQNEDLLRLSQQIGHVGSYSRDHATNLLTLSPEMRAICGLPASDEPIHIDDFVAMVVPADREPLRRLARETVARGVGEVAAECRIVRADDGRVRQLDLRLCYFYGPDGKPERSIGALIDATERKEAEKRIHHAAYHDPLTDLGNRNLFNERLEEACARVGRGEVVSVMVLDLDRFKDVNDTLSHPVGDRVLVEVGMRLRSQLRAGDTLARLGGDEFAIVQKSLREASDAGRLANRLVEKLRQPFLIDGHRISISASMGIAVAPRDGVHADELLKAADLALYEAKVQPQRGWRFYAPAMNAQARARFELEEDIRRALELEEFELFYQPVIHVATLRVRGFEALIRWRHPTRGLVPPDQFIPACEQNGLINEIGAWVLHRACADAVRWPEHIGVAVNISAIQVADEALDSIVSEALAESGLAPNRLELEVTETAMLNDTAATLEMLAKLKALGVRIAIDDFGTGHASLGYLRSFPFDKVKIDRTFARDVDVSAKSAAIVKAMLDLCSAYDLPTIIEGVETEGQLRTLAGMGGAKVQGYLFSPPRPLDCVPGLISRFSGAPALIDAAE